jgi:excisionase family DNA binding protein
VSGALSWTRTQRGRAGCHHGGCQQSVSRRRAGPRRLTLTVEEAGQLLGVSRSYAYELVRQGALPCMRLGRRIVIPVRALEALLDRVVAEATG